MKFEFMIFSFILFFMSMVVFFKTTNIIIMLMGIELMVNALNIAIANLVWIKYSFFPPVWVMIIFAITAAEAAIGLALIIVIAKRMKTLDVKRLSNIKEIFK